MQEKIQTFTGNFFALNTTIEGGFRTKQDLAKDLWRLVSREVKKFEQRFSRFLPDSELSRVNKNAGKRVKVSREFFDLLRAAQRIWSATSGLIDPTIGRALADAGYDASFELLEKKNRVNRLPGSFKAVTLADLSVDKSASTVKMPEGVSLDFGGLGKGYLLDQLAGKIEKSTEDYWLSLGGDLIISGTDEMNQAWPVNVQNPAVPELDLFQLRPVSGRWGIATSGTTKRRGERSGVPWHHIINPRTGRPADTDLCAVTVLAETALEADAFAKVVLLRGSRDGLNWARHQHQVEALAITNDGKVKATQRMKSYIIRL
ncbi:MAG: FAD:protein FMN transferase [Patescibacteria group bacterium]|jgi:thiamine biosynthesis lipoprotein